MSAPSCPALDLLSAPPSAWAVIELSSYQVADLTCGSELAVVTNIYEDHADWHGSATLYRRDKLRLLSLPGVRTCILPVELAAECGSGDVRHFDAADGWHVSGDGVRHPDGTHIPTHLFPLRGRHNATNLCAALAALDAAEMRRPPLPSALEDVDSLPHRLQTVRKADGIEWVDDSISTTPESAIAALEAFSDRPVVLIAGGQDRGQDYAELGQLAAQRGAVVIGLPTTGTRLVAAAVGAGISEDRALQVADMAEAVRTARIFAEPGTAVLLSPAAPSYNAYRDFEERGSHFAALASAR